MEAKSIEWLSGPGGGGQCKGMAGWPPSLPLSRPKDHSISFLCAGNAERGDVLQGVRKLLPRMVQILPFTVLAGLFLDLL